jgi:hypothetical protein
MCRGILLVLSTCASSSFCLTVRRPEQLSGSGTTAEESITVCKTQLSESAGTRFMVVKVDESIGEVALVGRRGSTPSRPDRSL